MVTVVVVAKHAHVLGKTADPALLLFRGIGMLQAGCSSPGAPVYPAAVVHKHNLLPCTSVRFELVCV